MATPSKPQARGFARQPPSAIQRAKGERRTNYHPEADSILEKSPHMRPRPGRRRNFLPTLLQLALCSVILLSTFCILADATPSSEGRRKQRYGNLASELPRWASLQPHLDSFQPGEIVYDRRFPVVPIQNDLYRRQDSVNIEESSTGNARTTTQKQLKFSSTSTASPAAATLTPATLPKSSSSFLSSSSSTPEPTSIVTAPGTDSSLPRPFDKGLGNNYTQNSCPNFINNFLRNETFTSCFPFSLLLENSMSFFSVTKTLASITRTLDATCKPIDSNCNSLVSSIALQLRQDENCAADYRRQQPLVTAAYNGLIAYEPLYRAGCTRDPDNGIYCFANAITNASSPTDSYPYYLPLGIALPGGSRPSCTSCLKETMSIFNQAAGDRIQQPLLDTYPAAAQMINVGCGPDFANQTVANSKSAGQSAGARTPVGSSLKLAVGVVLGASFAMVLS